MKIIGIAGGTASGKTKVSNLLADMISNTCTVSILSQDSYYVDFSSFKISSQKINYDHPDSFDTDLLIKHINILISGKSIEKPIYSYLDHTRLKETKTVFPTEVLIIEGILVLAIEKLKNFFDLSIFVDVDNDERILRRIKRDLKYRSRNLSDIIQQYLKSVKPMHYMFVVPSKKNADLILPDGASNLKGIRSICFLILNILKRNH